ncbi:ParB/RepB/Spo0J family partition protein [Kitasatospora sp. RB6PN24]|uniref:ParB/RepB/Spo0J family partition protein n=1 Tax=Kitasatospora humi TaxID=2893891 RepID=UPI001E6410AD|nr:ParB/RepB/Spo0J family partition protein [Kitasatospora humi]MCC9307419.1 ParB/RepB/Spo0J family partition protein [Kitasatospora humi]
MEQIPIEAVLPGDSPRFQGVDEEHVRRLAETDAELPPILVHRATMRVIDGAHRLRAAQSRGADVITVEFFEGSEAEAFILGVQANVAHGLPLSLAERKAAARRIVELQPELADRAVARATGLAASTVGVIRRQAAGDGARSGTRLGRDGRLRPVDGGEGRRRAVAVIRDSPDASLREIAQAAGVSLGTAHDIRARLDRGEDPLCRPEPQPAAPTAELAAMRRIASEPATARQTRPEPFAGLESLRRDPSLRFTDHGRALLVWLHRRLVVVGEAESELDNIPPHLLSVVAELAQECSDIWHNLSLELQYRARQIG